MFTTEEGALVACQPYGDNQWAIARVIGGPTCHQTEDADGSDQVTFLVKLEIVPEGEVSGGELEVLEENLLPLLPARASDSPEHAKTMARNCRFWAGQLQEIAEFLGNVLQPQ